MYFDISFRVPKNTLNNNSKLIEFIINDVTQVIQVENDKNDIRFKSILLAKIAHEFKNPINTINAISRKLNNEILKNPKLMSTMHTILKLPDVKDDKINNFSFIISLCDYLLFLIEDLNTFVKIGLSKKDKKGNRSILDSFSSSELSERSFTKKMTYLNLRQLLDFCYNLFYIKQAYDKSKPNLNVSKSYSLNLPDNFYTNETKLKQILINLLSNAYKFTVSGFVNLDVSIKNYENIKTLLFKVQDTGIGIDKDEMKNIFKPFGLIERNQSHNCHGSGLGLSIVNDILEMFESKIQVESQTGIGSTFYFELEVKNPNLLPYAKILEDDDEYDDLNILSSLNLQLNTEECKYIFT